MNVQRGDVVMVDWLFSDRTGSARRRLGAATQLEVDIKTPDGSQTGLVIDSVVQCENLVTVDRRFIQRIRGRFSAALMLKIDDCLKAALGIS